MGLFITPAQGQKLEKLESTYKFTGRADIAGPTNIECELVDKYTGAVWHKELGESEEAALTKALSTADSAKRLGRPGSVATKPDDTNRRLLALERENAELKRRLGAQTAPADKQPPADATDTDEDEDSTDEGSDEDTDAPPPAPQVPAPTIQRTTAPSLRPPKPPTAIKPPSATKPANPDGAPVKKT